MFLVDFQLIPTPSLHFQVALNLSEIASLHSKGLGFSGIAKMCYAKTRPNVKFSLYLKKASLRAGSLVWVLTCLGTENRSRLPVQTTEPARRRLVWPAEI